MLNFVFHFRKKGLCSEDFARHCSPGSRVPSDLFTNTTTRDLSSNKYSLEVFAHSFCPSYPDMKSLIKVLYDGFSQTDVRQKLFLC